MNNKTRDSLINDIICKAELLTPLDENNVLRLIIEDRDNNSILFDSKNNDNQ